MTTVSASQSCAADSTSVSSTVCRSNVERLIVLSASAVAVCCWRDLRSSFSRRVFDFPQPEGPNNTTRLITKEKNR